MPAPQPRAGRRQKAEPQPTGWEAQPKQSDPLTANAAPIPSGVTARDLAFRRGIAAALSSASRG
jgi:hypothetical protein